MSHFRSLPGHAFATRSPRVGESADRKEIARVPVGKGPRHERAANIPATVLAAVARAASHQGH
jgi:hypothetical protein